MTPPPTEYPEISRSPSPNVQLMINDQIYQHIDNTLEHDEFDQLNQLNPLQEETRQETTIIEDNSEFRIDLLDCLNLDKDDMKTAYEGSMFSTLIVVGLFFAGLFTPLMWLVSYVLFRNSTNSVAKSLSFLSFACFIFMVVSYGLTMGFGYLMKQFFIHVVFPLSEQMYY